MAYAQRAVRSVALLRSSNTQGIHAAQSLIAELGAAQAVLLPASTSPSAASAGVQDARQTAGAAWLAFAIKQLQAIPS